MAVCVCRSSVHPDAQTELRTPVLLLRMMEAGGAQSYSWTSVTLPFSSSCTDRTRDPEAPGGVVTLYCTYGLNAAPEGTPGASVLLVQSISVLLPSRFKII
jgi:hypothetical protein